MTKELYVKWTFEEKEYLRGLDHLRRNQMNVYNYLGCVQIGSLCVDFSLEETEDSLVSLIFSIFVPTEEEEIAEAHTKVLKIPYYSEGGDVITGIDLQNSPTFKAFQEQAVQQILLFIEKNSSYLQPEVEELEPLEFI